MKLRKNFGEIDFFIVTIIILCFLFVGSIFLLVHGKIKAKGRVLEKYGIEMTYWDIFFTDPEIVIHEGEVKIKNRGKND